MVSVFDIVLRPHHDPGVDPASNRNEYQGYFLRGKCGRGVGLINLGASTSRNPQGLSMAVRGLHLVISHKK